MTFGDGRTYLWWSSLVSLWAALNKPNTISGNGPVITLQGVTNCWEAPWMFKRTGIYHLAFAVETAV